ncbi:alpha/beta fold hydrolase [Actinoallomurus sp. NPDC050550]|uniref:alpha/beta fold hydrolase n=1 Tax=Actinoallomurus sp. NPDC050550 TaxID=3154937 RepID=UPI0033E05002
MSRAKLGGFTTPEGRSRFDRVYDEGMRLLPRPAEVHDVPTAFGRVRAYRFGEGGGAPIVLLHGTGGTSVMWRPNVAALAEKRSVYAIDLLGEAGRSEQTAPIRGAGDQAAWLAAVLERLDIPAAHLVGVSIGGWMACNQAVRAPERVASIGLLDPINTLARMSLGLILRTIPVVLPLTAGWARPRFLSWIDGQGQAAEDDPVGRVIGAGMRDYRAAMPTPAYFTDEEIRSIDVPALVLVAGRSAVHDPQRALRRAEALIGDVQAELWPDATHAISGQCADEVNARVLRFIDDVDGRSPGS